MCAVDGSWERVLTALMAQVDADGDLDWAVSVDSPISRAHQHSAEARKKGPRSTNPTPTPSADPAADRPRRSTSPPTAAPTTGIRSHRRTGWRCARLHRRHEPPMRAPAAGAAPHKTGHDPGRQGVLFPRDPRSPAQTRHPDGDPGTGGSAWPQTASRQPGRRPPAFDREAYKQRNTVERRINRLGQWRGIATRHEKTATNCPAGLHIAGVFLRSAR